VIVRILLWRLDEDGPTIVTVRERLEQIEPLPAPGVLLVNEAAERVGAIVYADDEDDAPPQVDELRALLGREPDVYEEFDAL
jgi:hypothetical protein